MVLFSELLSLFHALNTLWVSIFWGLALTASIVLGWKKGWILEGFHSLRTGWRKPGWFDILAGTIVAIILVLLFVVAVKSPVNNNDALLYHMSRTMHWAQNQSFQHYATNYEHQLYNPILAELIILQARLLTNSDQLANLVQWLALVGCIVGISGISQLLGNGRMGRWISVAFALSIPLAVLQATNPKNDLVTAFWLICLLFFIFINRHRENSYLEIITIGAALGLGLLTKGTFYVYAIAPVVYYGVILLGRRNLKDAILKFTLIAVIALIINLGYWIRNIDTFGTPLGSNQFVSKHTSNQLTFGKILGSNSLGIMQNFATPDEETNEKIISAVKLTLGKIDPSATDFSLFWSWNHEDYAGNPLHVVLVLLVILILALRFRSNKQIVNHYLFVSVGIYFFLTTIVFYGIFGIRFQIPVLLAFSPLVGVIDQMIQKKWLQTVATLLLLLSAFPWVLFNRTRPLIAMRDSNDPYTIPCYAGCTVGSILIEPPEKTMFAVWGSLGNAYVDAMQQVKATGCHEIGLKLDSNDLEYAYWYLLGAPQNGMQLESIVTYPELERYLDPNFRPCVIICTTCGEQKQLFGLERIGSYGDGRIKIFAGENYTPPKP